MPPHAGTLASDIPKGGWVDRILPVPLRPFARLSRLDRPIGTWLLLFPCWWGVALATPGLPSPWLIALFGIGAIVMRGAGCTYNDIVDRDFDARVARTADRPIPSGAVSVRGAVAWLLAQLLVGFAILVSLNATTIWLGVLSLVLVFTYPLMKRVTWWPQFFLGLAFNWGAWMGYCAVAGALGWPPALLYVAGIAWTLGYDTIYAHQDKEDDALIGVKSSARRLGDGTRPALALFYAAATVLLAASGAAASLGWPFYALLAAGAMQLAWQVQRVATDDPADCLAKFKSNRLFGWLILAGIVAGQIWR
ncbi:MAG: 4-hydroxybenzoate octaprenyltransferase [Alphaproteobacteria bacterium]|nr:4-hydroxybenzoate octaprenyltransferase [Alphaproteobacteria bacterium]